ncbi:Non-structural maintenance of chromosome element 3 [Pleurostoma richardsiae]|uniref:Non-structural maintenance of chromosome element 3 n=1 Tax=Pleurostoma richardsiae TaxID=41990 RepID=A0AA38S3G6_9PEZI|nr:Non-structural maintenance of chromosome element 3 [Pleurostoma richardsiae]
MPILQRRPRRAAAEVEDEQSEQEQRPRQKRRRDAEEEDSETEAGEQDDDENTPSDEEDQDQDQEMDGAQRDESEHAVLVKKLVRYALACEYSRTAIRRDGIKEKVLGNQGRAFKRVFSGAQKQLRMVFGMEMVELPTRDRFTKEEKRKAAKSQTKGQAASSNAYMLVSRLPDNYRKAAIIAPSLIQSAEDEAAYVAIYTLIIALITLNGGELSQPKLKRYLTRLNAETNTFNSTKTEDTLAKMVRHGYIVKLTDKEARALGDEEGITWYVGPRGKREVGGEAIAGVVREVYGGGSEELEEKLRASLKLKEAPVAQNEESRIDGDEAAEAAEEAGSD